MWTLRKSETLSPGASTPRSAPDELKEPDLELELDDEIPQIHADGAFSADAMTNDIGRADNRMLSARIPSFGVSFNHALARSEGDCRDKRESSLKDSKKYYNASNREN